MPNTSASTLLKHVWGERGYPVDSVWIASKLGLDVIEASLGNDVSGA